MTNDSYVIILALPEGTVYYEAGWEIPGDLEREALKAAARLVARVGRVDSSVYIEYMKA